VTTGGAGASANLTFGSLGRNAGATITFAGVNQALSTGGGNQVNFTTAAHDDDVTGGNILPYAAVTGPANAFDFASVTGTGVVPFAGYTTAGINGSTSVNDVVKVTANDTLTADRTVAAVLLSGNNLPWAAPSP